MKSMNDTGLPCLDLLEATPTILRGLMAELSPTDVRWKPAPDRFSVGEVLAHLSHTEGHCYRTRLDRFLSEDNPEFESDDAQHHLELYRNMDPEDAFDHFEEQRETNIEALRDLPPGAGERRAVHQKVGPITLAANAERMGAARSRTHPADRRIGARAQISGRRGSAGRLLPTETMTIQRLLLAFALAGNLAAQTFIQMSDPQFGMFTKDVDFAHETANFEFAIATANRLKPAFVVITGDLINKTGDATQAAEYKRITSKLDPKIKLYSAPGNHDVGNEPTAESLALYRERFGADYYSFRAGDIVGLVLNSNLEKGADKVPEEAAKMEAWFRGELERAKQTGARHIIVFQHISFFLKDPNEADQYFNIPKPVRERYLRIAARVRRETGLRRPLPPQRTRARRRPGNGDLRPRGHAAGRREIRPPRRHRERRYGDAQILRFRRTPLTAIVGQVV